MMNQFVYDPNEARSFEYVQNVRIRIQQWEFTKEYLTSVGGNVPGFEIFICAISNIVDGIIGDDDIDMDSEVNIQLEDKKGNTLEVNLNEEGDPEEAFKDMVIAVEIVGVEKSGEKHGKNHHHI